MKLTWNFWLMIANAASATIQFMTPGPAGWLAGACVICAFFNGIDWLKENVD